MTRSDSPCVCTNLLFSPFSAGLQPPAFDFWLFPYSRELFGGYLYQTGTSPGTVLRRIPVFQRGTVSAQQVIHKNRDALFPGCFTVKAAGDHAGSDPGARFCEFRGAFKQPG